MFPFEPVPYKQYKYSFLDKIYIKIDFKIKENDNCENNSLKKIRFKKYISDNFNVPSDDLEKLKGLNILIKSDDDPLIVSFSEKSVEIFHAVQNYENFSASILPIVSKLESFFLDIAEIEEFSEIILSKENVWNVTIGNDTQFNSEELRKHLLSERLIEKFSDLEAVSPELPDIRNIKKYFTNGELPDSQLKSLLYITSYDTYNVEKGNYELIYNEMLRIPNYGLSSFERLISVLKEMNKVLYDCFHWSVNDDIIKIMERG